MQTSLFNTDASWPLHINPEHNLDTLLATYEPTSIWVSVSGGIDSDVAAVWARRRWPHLPIVLWHAYLAEMDWPQTQDHLELLAIALGNCRLMIQQAVYERTGGTTPGGHESLKLRRSHDVARFGPAADADPAAVKTLWDLVAARSNMPPTSGIRYCTKYLKGQLCDHDLRAHRSELGARPLLLSGERWAESANRADVPRAEWRVPLQPSRKRPEGHAVLWMRPVVDLALHQVTRMVLDAAILPHPGYELQGETLAPMLDPHRPERGRARLSCVTCIFGKQGHLQHAYDIAPDLIGPFVERAQQFEMTSGYTWQQAGPLIIR